MPVKSKNYVITLAGPTAVGKTELAIELALHFNTVILSADSRQMYRQMTIGTAKPTEKQQKTVQHYFIDNLDITDAYSAGRWEEDALKLLNQLFDHHDIVIVVGGSGLYLKALLEGLDQIPPVPATCKEKWDRLGEDAGLEFLQTELKIRDPDYYGEVDLNNLRRLTRALALIDFTGQPYSSLRLGQAAIRPFTTIRAFCNLPRETLYERINNRVDHMMADGLLAEARLLQAHRNLQALQTVGYTELFEHLQEKCDLEFAVDKIKQHTRNYAKRQITWFRNQGDWREFNPPDSAEIIAYLAGAMGV